MGFQAYGNNTPMQIPMLKLNHYSTFSWEEGSIEQRGFTKEEVLSLQLIEAVTRKAARLFGIDLGTPSTMLKGAGLTLSISFADKIADPYMYRPTEGKDSRGMFIRDAAADEFEAGMRNKSKLTCGWCKLDPSASIKNSERSWANLPALLKHQHSGFHALKPRNVHDAIHSHAAEQNLATEKTSRHHETTDTIPQQLVEVKNKVVSGNGGLEDGTGKRNLELPKQSKYDDARCTWLRNSERSNEVERPILSFSEVITDRYMEENQMRRGNNKECNSPVPPSFASSQDLEEVPSDRNFLSPTGQGIKAPCPVHELDEDLPWDTAPESTTGKFVEPQPDLINFGDTTSETRSTGDWQDPWMIFRDTGDTLLDSF
ncbi:uncharacterized protein EAE98_002005 [Botrytis deweyae]|uniref:Uncharacterized protein n=1 Tax=Botrytis deweyae TaxID=2478750 RepID=A0ABQ7IZQ7_9HELO|nr:uncharacterized protein EAE98_002005 [Botrytis deweyae]KAF7937691.1 hypothetical protein EAE98_002005 [Botrytis deweyae]